MSPQQARQQLVCTWQNKKVIQGCDTWSGGGQISETTKQIASKIKGADKIDILNLDYFNYKQKDVEEYADKVLQEYLNGNNIILYGYSAGGEFLQQVSRYLSAKNVHVELLITVDAAGGPNSLWGWGRKYWFYWLFEVYR